MSRIMSISAVTLLSVMAAANAQTYPAKPVRIIVPFPPGGGTDIVARAVGQKLGEALGQTFVIDNRSGAGGTVGSETAAKAPADGYTLAMATSSTHGVAPSLYTKLGYDPVRDFAAVTLVATTPFVLVVHPSLPVKTAGDLIALAKRQPGKLNYASAGNGSSNHLTVEMFNMMAGVKMTHVPYKGSGPALVDLMAGQVDLATICLRCSILSTRARCARWRSPAPPATRRCPTCRRWRRPGCPGMTRRRGMA